MRQGKGQGLGKGQYCHGKGKGRGGNTCEGGAGRMGGRGSGAGGECICPQCGARTPHQPGIPCAEQKCHRCGVSLVRG